MNNGTCSTNGSGLEQIEQIGGDTFTDTLYRSAAGKYFLKSATHKPFPEGKSYTLPDDAAKLAKDTNSKSTTEEISESEAMLWYVREFLNDEPLRAKFTSLIEASDSPEPSPSNVIRVTFRSTVSARIKKAA